MPWHLSKSDPRKVYDERHQQVGVMQTEDYARIIVEGVNAFLSRGGQITLREPLAGASQCTVGQTPNPIHVSQADGCCTRPFAKASQSGQLDSLKPWECPKCGTMYTASQQGPVVNWTAQACAMIIGPRS